MSKHTDDDVGFDEEGRVIQIGDEAGKTTSAIVDHPDATPVLIVAQHGGDVGVRVFGPPDERVADLLDHVAKSYRQAVALHRAKSQ